MPAPGSKGVGDRSAFRAAGPRVDRSVLPPHVPPAPSAVRPPNDSTSAPLPPRQSARHLRHRAGFAPAAAIPPPGAGPESFAGSVLDATTPAHRRKPRGVKSDKKPLEPPQTVEERRLRGGKYLDPRSPPSISISYERLRASCPRHVFCGGFETVRRPQDGRAGRAVRRGAIDPEVDPKAPHRAFGEGQNAPVRAMRTSRPPCFRRGRLQPAGPDREKIGAQPAGQPVSAQSLPPRKWGEPGVQRAHPFRAPRAHLTQRERHHHCERQAHARAHPGHAPEEVRLELEATVQTGVDPFQGRAPKVAALSCGATVEGGGEDVPSCQSSTMRTTRLYSPWAAPQFARTPCGRCA